MSFTLEREMTKPVRRWLRSQELLIKEEFSLPWGVCDFIALSFDPARTSKRLSFGQHRPIGPLHRLELLRHIPDHESGKAISIRRLEKLYEREMLGRQCFDTELQRLRDDRFVISTPNGNLQKLNGWAPLHNRIVAVELKLSRVSDAFAQAATHRAFATESYIAMPKEIARNVAESPRAADFRIAGVGILAVTRTTCTVVLPATEGAVVTFDETLQMHCAERFWRTRDSSS